ncbi:hypothetical protein TeGR_g8118 [Tetraparma gracilis]|uniref:PHD-type domain-containing protein n=1 Tax=Tetraparma gracilis TaxID=2962635 RepID=A0ABQ6MGG5_9STRA|nr:hypothetical protein TeGR_g8118 [Tetraparma gracilis]
MHRYASLSLSALSAQQLALQAHLLPPPATVDEVLARLPPSAGRRALQESVELLRYLREATLREATEAGGTGDESESDYSSDEELPYSSSPPPAPSAADGDSDDTHNDFCRVCERGGDLICCDTCSLAFHLQCIRPVQKVVPRGQWNCMWCVSSSIGISHVKKNRVASVVKIAERAVREMERMKSEGEASAAPAGAAAPAAPAAASAQPAGAAGHSRSGRKRKAPKNFDPEAGPASAWGHAAPAAPPVASASPKASPMLRRKGYSCAACLDNRAVRICLSCACRVCFGKHDQAEVLLCDGCDAEYHVGCVRPPMEEMPGEDDDWYCPTCAPNHPSASKSTKKKARAPRRSRAKEKPENEPTSFKAPATSRSGRTIKVSKKPMDLGFKGQEQPQVLRRERSKSKGGGEDEEGGEEGDDEEEEGGWGADDEEAEGERRREQERREQERREREQQQQQQQAAAAAAAQPAYQAPQQPDRSRKPGGRECMNVLRKTNGHPLSETSLSQVVDYAFRGKVEQIAVLRDAIGLLHDTLVDMFAVPLEGGGGGAVAAAPVAAPVGAATAKTGNEAGSDNMDTQ